MDLSDDRVMLFIFSNETVIPPGMLEAPANAAWPPLFTANGHCVNRERSTTIETCAALEGLNTHWGVTDACCCDQ